MRPILAPSILAYDHCDLCSGLKEIEDFGAKFVHVDVMDGTFVPNIAFGQGVVESLRKRTDLILDVHLMVSTPFNLVESFVNAGSDIITVHVESGWNISKTLQLIHSYGKKTGIAVKPNTPLEEISEYLSNVDIVLVMGVEPGMCGQKFLPNTLDRIKRLASIRETNNLDYEISVDGGINATNAKLVTDSGADIIVSGSSFFLDKEKFLEFV